MAVLERYHKIYRKSVAAMIEFPVSFKVEDISVM